MQWLWFSLVASVVLTVVLNVAIRLWPGATERADRRLDDWAVRQHTTSPDAEPRVRVVVPWRAMLLVSVLGTILLNVVLRLA